MKMNKYEELSDGFPVVILVDDLNYEENGTRNQH